MNEMIFNQITDDNVAYWLGFLAADGCVQHIGNKYQLMIGLSSKDREHLEKFKNFLNTSVTITDRNTLCKNNGKYYPSSYITILSQQIFNDLNKYGIIPNKSHQDIDFLSYIPEQYKIPFILGLIDGDGNFTCTEKNQSFGLCGNKLIINSCHQYLHTFFSNWQSKEGIVQDQRSLITYSFTIYTQNQIIDFCKLYLSYSDKCDLLERKKEKAQNLISILEEKLKKSKLKKLHITKLNGKYVRPRIKQICPICGKEFLSPRAVPYKYCSQECVHKSQYRCEHPDKDILYNQLIEHRGNFTQVAKIYGVTDNAVRKWCKKYNIPFHSKDYK